MAQREVDVGLERVEPALPIRATYEVGVCQGAAPIVRCEDAGRQLVGAEIPPGKDCPHAENSFQEVGEAEDGVRQFGHAQEDVYQAAGLNQGCRDEPLARRAPRIWVSGAMNLASSGRMTKNEIAGVLEEIGTLLELKGENPFKVRAYQAGARALEAIEEDELVRLIAAGELKSVKGIGDALAQKIVELHTTGRLEFCERLRESIAPGLVEMLQIPGLGPKKIRALHDRLGLTDIAGLAAACAEGRVAELDGFGVRTQEKLLAGIRNREAYGQIGRASCRERV